MLRRWLGLALLTTTAGCALNQTGSALRTVSPGRDIAMSADYRMIYKRDRNDDTVFCAEPSPDIGRIVAAASSANLAGSAKGLERVQPELALAFAALRAEGLTQLGQRLATIQLLRDSTFRACEAYANKAISEATYAMIVSRYDDVMVTLLLAEMAANGARPQGPALLAGAAVTGGNSGQVAAALGRMSATSDAVTKADARVVTAAEADQPAAKQAAADARRDQADALAALNKAVSEASATGAATGGVAREAPSPLPAVAVAKELAAMQKVYLNDFNLDAVTVGCLSALSQLDWPQHRRSEAGQPASAAPVPPPPGPVAAATLDPAAGPVTFVSTNPTGAYSFQDECRAILLNGQTLRAAAQGRLNQIAKGNGE